MYTVLTLTIGTLELAQTNECLTHLARHGKPYTVSSDKKHIVFWKNVLQRHWVTCRNSISKCSPIPVFFFFSSLLFKENKMEFHVNMEVWSVKPYFLGKIRKTPSTYHLLNYPWEWWKLTLSIPNFRLHFEGWAQDCSNSYFWNPCLTVTLTPL